MRSTVYQQIQQNHTKVTAHLTLQVSQPLFQLHTWEAAVAQLRQITIQIIILIHHTHIRLSP
ncbi:MAG TPA: hypothetical protein VHV10_15600 [Ktedonobacteraceae bacterium]|jgi:hypothetical protein|nr:hypothetical protein [Ktedonobacteraceae bacterium]